MMHPQTFKKWDEESVKKGKMKPLYRQFLIEIEEKDLMATKK